MNAKHLLATVFCLVPLSSAVLSAAPERKLNWETVKISKADYVSVSQIAKFYGMEKEQGADGKVLLRSKSTELRLQRGAVLGSINGVNYRLADKVEQKNGALYVSVKDLTDVIDPVLRVNALGAKHKVTTVVLDTGSGRGDKDTARHSLAVALLAKPLLEKKGFNVVLTRAEDVFVPMRDRVAIARAATDAIVISLSCNSGAKKNRGLETHALVGIGANAAAKLTSSRSMALATVLHSRSLQYVNSKAVTGMSFDVQDRAISRAPYSILAGCQHPCAILEMGFVTNKEDAAMLNEETFRAAIARAVTRSAEVYRNVVAPKNAKPAAPAGRVGRAKGAGGVEGAFAWPK